MRWLATLPVWLAPALAALLAVKAEAGMRPIGVVVAPWRPGTSSTLTALFIEDRGTQPTPPAFELCARAGVTFGAATALFPSGLTLAAAPANDCRASAGFQGVAFVVPGLTTTAAEQVYKLRVPFTVAASYAGSPNYPGGPLDPQTLELRVIGASGTPGARAAAETPSVFSIEEPWASRSSTSPGAAIELVKHAYTDSPQAITFRVTVDNRGGTDTSSFYVEDVLDPAFQDCKATTQEDNRSTPVYQPVVLGRVVVAHNGLAGGLSLARDPNGPRRLIVTIRCRVTTRGSYSNSACVNGGNDPRLPPEEMCARIGFQVTGPAPLGFETAQPVLAVSSFVTGAPGALPELGLGGKPSVTTVITNVGDAPTAGQVRSTGVIGSYWTTLERVTGTFYLVRADGSSTAPRACPPYPVDNDACDTGTTLLPGESLVIVRVLRVRGLPATGGLLLRDRAYFTGSLLARGEDVPIAVLPGVPATGPLAAPWRVAATAIAGRKVRLRWSDYSYDEDSFRVEMKTGTGAFREVTSVGPGIQSVVISGLTARTRYTFRVRARRGTVFSPYSSQVVATALP